MVPPRTEIGFDPDGFRSGAFSPVIPIRLVWLEAVAGLFGGGYLVALALVLVIVSDVTPTSQRYSLPISSICLTEADGACYV